MKTKFLVLASVLGCAIIFCQAQGDPKWKIDLGGKANWMTITSVGSVVTATNTSLMSIDPVKQVKVWEIKASAVSKESFVGWKALRLP